MHTNSPKIDRRIVRLCYLSANVITLVAGILMSASALRAADDQTINDFDWYNVSEPGQTVDLNSIGQSSYDTVDLIAAATSDDGYDDREYTDSGVWVDSSGGNYETDSYDDQSGPSSSESGVTFEDVEVDGSGNWTAGTMYKSGSSTAYNVSLGDGNLTMGGYADSSNGNGAQVWDDVVY